jgi:hypothetical protein
MYEILTSLLIFFNLSLINAVYVVAEALAHS